MGNPLLDTLQPHPGKPTIARPIAHARPELLVIPPPPSINDWSTEPEFQECFCQGNSLHSTTESSVRSVTEVGHRLNVLMSADRRCTSIDHKKTNISRGTRFSEQLYVMKTHTAENPLSADHIRFFFLTMENNPSLFASRNGGSEVRSGLQASSFGEDPRLSWTRWKLIIPTIFPGGSAAELS